MNTNDTFNKSNLSTFLIKVKIEIYDITDIDWQNFI